MRILYAVILLLSLTLFASAQRTTERFEVNFASGAAVLDAEALSTVSRVADLTAGVDRYSIVLHGHTDQVGSEEFNLRLSAKRVSSVRNQLGALGLDTARTRTAGFGESRLKTVGTNETDLAANRRVEIELITLRVNSDALLQEVLAEAYTHADGIDHAAGGTVRGREGVVVDVPAKAFVRADGSELPDGAVVDILLEEATRPSSMVAHRLNTNGATSGRLQTGGMVRVTGSYHGEELRLREGEAIGVTIPTARADDEMRLYVGSRTEDGSMDWTLEPEESIDEGSRIGVKEIKRVMSPQERAQLAEVRRLLKLRDSAIALVRFPAALTERPVRFPKLRAWPKEYDPNAGVPKRPYTTPLPKRKVVTRGSILRPRSVAQRKADAQFVTDSVAYVAAREADAARISSWEAAVEAFRRDEPNRRARHEARVREIEQHRVAAAREYLRDQHHYRAAQKFELWRMELRKRGPHASASMKRLRRESLCAKPLQANPLIVLGKAYRPETDRSQYEAEAAKLHYDVHEQELYDEYGHTATRDFVAETQAEIAKQFMTVQQRRRLANREKSDALNSALIAQYSFEIRTAEPRWHNCDHPIPPGEFQLLVERESATPAYFSSRAQGTIDYYVPGMRAAAVYLSTEPVDVVSFGATEEGVFLATGQYKPSRRRDATAALRYEAATLTAVEEAIAGLDG